MELPSKIPAEPEVAMRRLNSVLWRTNPRMKAAGPQMTRPHNGLMPKAERSAQVVKPPSMMNSPCEMFSTRATPYCRLSPIAMTA